MGSTGTMLDLGGPYQSSHPEDDRMATGQRAAPGRWLLPHERWLGRSAGRVTAPPRGGQRWRFRQNYAPEADVFLPASVANLMAALILLIAGPVPALTRNDREYLTCPLRCIQGTGSRPWPTQHPLGLHRASTRCRPVLTSATRVR